MSEQHHEEHRWEHEQEDVRPRFIAVLYGGILALVLLSMGVMAAMTALLNAYEEPPTIAETRLPQSEPRLQFEPYEDLMHFQSTQQAFLNSYGRMEDGSVHIPIDQAMARLVQTGMPTVNAEATADATAEASGEPRDESNREDGPPDPAASPPTEEASG